ncbi:MAG TPA: DUF5652 family protein [Candidatus Paceibacterota bacterium]
MNNYMYGPGGDWGPGHMFLASGGNEWFLPFWLGALLPLALLFVVWSVFWKGLALWHAARRGQYWWFLILLVVNTAGILEIIYLFFVAKLKLSELFSKHTHLAQHNHAAH